MKVFYHADLDGKCSAAVVNFWSECQFDNVQPTYAAINYKDDFPFDSIRDGEDVWIVDFSLQKPGDWQRLLAITDDVVWIDHHKSAIERSDAEGVAGLRRAEGAAGCELTWEYVARVLSLEDQEAPRAVQLIGDYDTWTFAHGEETRRFKAYAESLCDTDPVTGWEHFWKPAIYKHPSWDSHQWVRMLDLGGAIIASETRAAQEIVGQWAFSVTFEGHYGCALNRARCGSDFFESVADAYDLLLPFVFDGEQWTVSVYRGGTGDAIDCAGIAERYGGGGHAGAAGFQCAELPWVVIDK